MFRIALIFQDEPVLLLTRKKKPIRSTFSLSASVFTIAAILSHASVIKLTVSFCLALKSILAIVKLIVYVMFSGAGRLELRQNKNYGEDAEYQGYIHRVPILLPFSKIFLFLLTADLCVII